MKKTFISFLALSCFAFFMACRAEAKKQPLYSQWMVESQGLQWVNGRNWDYVSGLVSKSVIKAWKQYPEKTYYYEAVKDYADRSIRPDNTVKIGESNIDDLAAGKIFFELYQQEKQNGNTTEADKLKAAADFLRDKLKFHHARIAEGRDGAGGFYHKRIYPNQMWLDGLYMGPALYAEWQANFAPEDSESWSDIALQFKTIHRYTYNPETKLNYHAWSAAPEDANSFWAKKEEPMKGRSPEVWGRGMGWFFAALVDVLEVMPKSHPDYAELVRIVNQVAEGLAERQDKQSGVWCQLLQYPVGTVFYGENYKGATYAGTKQNYPEASASSMFTYAYIKGIRLGVLDKAVYNKVAKRAYEGLIKTFISGQETGVIGINQSCLSAGLGPASKTARDGSAEYYLFYDQGNEAGDIVSNEGKAIGPFIMASLEYERFYCGK